MTDDRAQGPHPGGPEGPGGAGGVATDGRAGGAAGERPPLARSDRHRVVAGVCGGLGRHLDIDPVVFRVVVAVLCVSGGLGLFLYGLAWLIVPNETTGRTEIQRVLTGHVDAQSIGAVLLTVIGTGVFFSWMGHGDHLFPLLLLGVLIFFAVRYDPERRRREQSSGAEAEPPRQPGPFDRHMSRDELKAWRRQWREQWHAQRQQFREEWRERREEMRQAYGAHSPTGYRWDPRHPERNPYASYEAPPVPPTAAAWWQREDLPAGDPLRKAQPAGGPPPRPAVPYEPPYKRERSFLGPFAFALSLGAGATVWALSGGPEGSVRPATVLAAVLLVQGLALLVAARRGRARGLVVPALLLTLALAAVGTTALPLKASVGNRAWVPATAAQVQPLYSLGAGDARLDLSAVDPAGGTVRTGVHLGAGDLTVTVPSDVTVHLAVRSAAGGIRLPDRTGSGGLGNSQTADLAPAKGAAAKGRIDLDIELGLGDVRVVRASAAHPSPAPPSPAPPSPARS